MTGLDTDLAAAADAWGGSSHPARLISHRENAVYEVDLAGTRAAMRLHRPGYRTKGEILSELQWCEALADVGFPAPRPIRTQSGGLIHTLRDGQFVTVIGWMSGAPIGAGDAALGGSTDQQCALYRDIGGLLARLHNRTDTLSLPDGFTRPHWDRDGLVGPNPLWGRYWQAGCLSTADADLVCAARDRAGRILAEFDAQADCGLIHADALRENVFRTDTGLALIDFDDAGHGYRLYELGSCLTQSVDEPAFHALSDALLDGYGAERPLSARARALYPMFSMLRSFSALGWTMPRLASDHPKLATYRARALTQAQGFLEDRSIG